MPVTVGAGWTIGPGWILKPGSSGVGAWDSPDLNLL